MIFNTMHIRRTTSFLLLFFLVTIANIGASDGQATAQKPLILNAVSSTPYNPITTVPKISYKQPIVLNQAVPQSWHPKDEQLFYGNRMSVDVSSWQRVTSCIAGTAQLAVAVPGIPVVLFGLMVTPTALYGELQLGMLGTLTMACLLEARLLCGGIANAHNTFAAENDQIVLRTDGRLVLGAAELGLAGICALIASVWPTTGEIFYPGCLAFGLFGVSDVCLAAHDKHRGLTIARF